jgi:hypothetical protein
MSGQRKRVNALMVVEEDKRDDDNSTGASSGGKTRKRSGRDSVARDQGGAGADQRTYPTGARRTCLDGKCPWGAVLCDAATAKLTAAGDRRGGYALYPSADAVDPDEKQRYKRFNVHMQRKGRNPGNKAEYFSRAHIRGVHWRGEQRIKLIKTHDGSAVKVDAAGASTR